MTNCKVNDSVRPNTHNDYSSNKKGNDFLRAVVAVIVGISLFICVGLVIGSMFSTKATTGALNKVPVDELSVIDKGRLDAYQWLKEDLAKRNSVKTEKHLAKL